LIIFLICSTGSLISAVFLSGCFTKIYRCPTVTVLGSINVPMFLKDSNALNSVSSSLKGLLNISTRVVSEVRSHCFEGGQKNSKKIETLGV